MHIFYAHKALQSGTSFAERPPPSRVPPTGAPGSCRRAAGRATGRVSHQGLRVLNSHEPIRDVLAQSGCRVLWLCLRLCLFTVYLAGADAVAGSAPPCRRVLVTLMSTFGRSTQCAGDKFTATTRCRPISWGCPCSNAQQRAATRSNAQQRAAPPLRFFMISLFWLPSKSIQKNSRFLIKKR